MPNSDIFANLPDDLAEQMRSIDAAFAADRERIGEFAAGRLFRVNVADGFAVYEVTRVGQRTAHVACRHDLSIDGWEDPTLGDGGSFPRAAIERHVVRQDNLSRLFARR